MPFQKLPSRAQLEQNVKSAEDYQRWRAKGMLAILDRGQPLSDGYSYPICVWRFGSSFRFIALGGEVVSDYCLRLKRQYGFDDTWVAGYSNDVFGYVASRRVLEEGGNANTNFPGPFAAAIEELMIGKTADLIRQVTPADRK